MGMSGYIGFLTGKPVVWVPLLVFVISAVLETLLLFLFSCTTNKRKTFYVMAGANFLYVLGSELIFKILYGTWFTSVYRVGPGDFFVRLACSLVVVLALGNVLLKREIIRIWRFNIVLGVGVVAAAIASLMVERLFFI